jgi:cobalt-zinc-cadmium resistance protein CzcA
MSGWIHHSHGVRKVPVVPAQAILQTETGSTVFVSLVIIIAAYLPLFMLERTERRLFTPMAFTACYALLGSLLLTTTLVPVLATYLFSEGPRIRQNPLLAWLAPRYGRLLQRSLERAPAVVGVALAIAAAAMWLGATLGTEFLAQLDEGVIWIRAALPAGVTIEKSAEMAGRIRTLIHQSPEV